MFIKSNEKPQKIHPKDQAAQPTLKKNYSFCMRKFEEFCKRTDLHGYKYIVMPDLTVVEKCCWLISVLVSIGCAVYFVITAYLWYARNPIVTVIESTHGAIWDVPFPAVTICDVNLISRKAAIKFSQDLRLPANTTEDQVFEALKLAPLIHSTYRSSDNQKQQLAMLQAVLDYNNIKVVDVFKRLSPASSCKDLVQRCMWKNTVYRCEMLFEPIYTQFSLCCTFNFYAYKISENISELYRPPTPRRVASCGYQTALTLLLNNNMEDYYSSLLSAYGIMVIIDNAYNLPNRDSPSRLVSPMTEMFIALTPERTYATSGIKSFTPQERQCFFRDEVKIADFRHYSYHNCIMYRWIQKINKMCQCLPYFFPTQDTTRKCNFTDIPCLENTQRPLEKYETTDLDQPQIQCLPDCEHYDYPLEVALGLLAKDAPLDGLTFYKDVKLENRSLLNIFFNDLVSTRYRRDVYLNWQNLLSAFGGLLSLMLGFTLISAIDCVIFFTFRMGYDLFASRDRNDSVQKAPLKNNQILVKDVRKREDLYWKVHGHQWADIKKY